MATKKTDLEIDYIGGLGPLSAEEQNAISQYFKKLKESSKHLPNPKKQHLRKSKSAV